MRFFVFVQIKASTHALKTECWILRRLNQVEHTKFESHIQSSRMLIKPIANVGEILCVGNIERGAFEMPV